MCPAEFEFAEEPDEYVKYLKNFDPEKDTLTDEEINILVKLFNELEDSYEFSLRVIKIKHKKGHKTKSAM